MKGSIVIVVVTIVIVVADVEVEVDVAAADGNCYAKELHSPIDVGSEVCW